MTTARTEEETIELPGIQLPEGTPDLFDVGDDPPVEPTPETPPALEIPPEAPPAPVTPGLPEWLSADPAERKTQLETALNALSLEERLGLAPVSEIAQGTRDYTAAETERRVSERLQQGAADDLLETAASSFANDLAMAIPLEADFDIQNRTNDLIEAAQANYHGLLARDAQTGIASALGRLNALNLPPNVVQAIEQAPSFGRVVETYVNYAASVGYQMGVGQGEGKATKRSESDDIAWKTRTRNELLGEMGKKGEVVISRDNAGDYHFSMPNDTPPRLSGQPGSLSGEISDEDLTNPDRLEALMNDPERSQELRRLMTAALR